MTDRAEGECWTCGYPNLRLGGHASWCAPVTAMNAVPSATGKRPEKYPWDEWLDGDVWTLTRGEDFACMVISFHDVVRKAAKRRGLKVATRTVGESVVIQASEPSTSCEDLCMDQCVGACGVLGDD